MYELPGFSFLAVYFVSLQIIDCNSRSSTHWKLRVEEGKVLSDPLSLGDVADDDVTKCNNDVTNSNKAAIRSNSPIEDTVLDILATTLMLNGQWVRDGHSDRDCDTETKSTKRSNSGVKCTPEANFTDYDHLSGISKRHSHPQLLEPDEINLINGKSLIDLNILEKKLKKSIKEKPDNRDILLDIGNFLRIKGDTSAAIECFRKILRQIPTDSEALLNLARILFHLGYLEDAAFLTRKSLETEQAHPTAHLHHFTLGEILKAYGHYYEASLYFKQALILKPDYQPAKDYLKELRSFPESRVHAYTLFIIIFLVMGVLLGILSTFEAVRGHGCEGVCSCSSVDPIKTQRHFNRAMAMRSMKMAVNSRPFRFRK